MSSELVRFDEALGARLKERRTAGGYSQDQVATAARDVGLNWSRSTVAAIEAGHRTVPFEELVLLPLVWGRLDGGINPTVELSELLPERGFIRLTDHAGITADALRAAVEGRLTDPGRQSLDDFDTPTHSAIRAAILASREGFKAMARKLGVIREHWDGRSPLTVDLLWEIERAAAGEAERKAAAKLGVSPFQVSLAAFHKWNQSLTSVRDKRVEHRVNAQPPAVVGRDQLVRDGTEILPRTLQALRGHETRMLVDGIAAELEREPWMKEM